MMDWSIHPILLDIREVMSTFEVISFSHVPRRFNSFAHELAKKSYGLGALACREEGGRGKM